MKFEPVSIVSAKEDIGITIIYWDVFRLGVKGYGS